MNLNILTSIMEHSSKIHFKKHNGTLIKKLVIIALLTKFAVYSFPRCMEEFLQIYCNSSTTWKSNNDYVRSGGHMVT
jgi:hypothetical protein